MYIRIRKEFLLQNYKKEQSSKEYSLNIYTFYIVKLKRRILKISSAYLLLMR